MELWAEKGLKKFSRELEESSLMLAAQYLTPFSSPKAPS